MLVVFIKLINTSMYRYIKKTLEMVQIINCGKSKLFESKVYGNKYLQ